METSEYKSKLLQRIQDNKKSPSIESKRLLEIAKDENKLNLLINILNDADQSIDKKQDALNVLNAISIFSPKLPTTKPAFVNALRGLMANENRNLRLTAFSCLAIMKDEIAQERLKELIVSSEDESAKLVPTHQAIAMLGYDEKALDYDALKEIAKNPPNNQSLIEALRHLPFDADTFNLLQTIMEDDTKPIEARSMLPEILNNLDTEAFLNSTNRIIKNNGLGDDLVPYLAKGVVSIETNYLSDKVEETKSQLIKLVNTAPKDFKEKMNRILFPKK
ncbi:MAG: hypothetical protein AAF655_09860 [Bacteroidota bacterium]